MRTVYPRILLESMAAYAEVADDALDYLQAGTAGNREASLHVLRHLLGADYERRGDAGRGAVRDALRWMLNCAPPDQQEDVAGDIPDFPVIVPADTPQLLFDLWWEALFDDEDWRSDDICDAEVVSADVDRLPAVLYDGDRELEVSPDIVKFPRTDGLPPGHGAPDKVIETYDGPSPLPRRPTDGARFFRYEDQADALEAAIAVHAGSGQWKVWVAFDWPVGEGYLKGGEEYRRTSWACVRFYDGKPVDSWPDLRKGWKERR